MSGLRRFVISVWKSIHCILIHDFRGIASVSHYDNLACTGSVNTIACQIIIFNRSDFVPDAGNAAVSREHDTPVHGYKCIVIVSPSISSVRIALYTETCGIHGE